VVARRSGFTLIEIMAALAVLAIGLTSTLAIVTSSMRLSNNASDRNITRALIDEAIGDIERAHRITDQLKRSGVPWKPAGPEWRIPAPWDEQIGSYIETVTSTDNAIPTIHHSEFREVDVGSKNFDFHLTTYCTLGAFSPGLTKATTRTLMWPFGNTPKFIGGPVASGPSDPGSFAYRVVYRLERDPLWYPHPPDCTGYIFDPTLEDSPYAGLYRLTLVVYRDLDRKGGRLEQLTDPVIVFLRDRKVRQ